MLLDYKLGQTSIVLRVKLLNSSVTTGAGLTGLTSASAGLKISTIADNEATATTYTQAGSTIEGITTLGTYAAPTATKCRFKELDSSGHPGVYEIQIADARFAVASAKSLLISISGATNCAETDVVVPLRSVDPYDGVRFGLTALPNAAAEAAGGLYTRGTGAGQIKQTNNGEIDANATRVNNVATSSVTTVNANLGTTQPTNYTGTGASALVKGDVQDYLGAAAPALQGGRFDASVGAYQSGQAPLQPTVAGRTLDVSAGGEAGLDWANVGTPGSTVNLSATTVNLVNTLTTYTGNTPQTGDNFARIGAAGAGLTALGDARLAHLDADVSSRLAASAYTAPPSAASVASAVLTTQMAESYNAVGVAPTLAQACFVVMQRLTEFAIVGSALTVLKLDGSTPAYGLTLNSSTAPTSSARTS